MRITINIILLCTIACALGVLLFFACQRTYESRLSQIEETALNTFATAIDSELKARNLKSNVSLHFNLGRVLANCPDTISWEDASGKYVYAINHEKSALNITDDPNKRVLHTIAFVKKPLQPDTLNTRWMEQLRLSNLSYKSALRISVINTDGSIKSQNTYQNIHSDSSNLVFTRYIGYACEIEVAGYLCFSKWDIIYKDALLYLLLYAISVFASYKLIIFLSGKLRSLRTKEIIEVVNEVPVEVIKEVPVEVHVYEEVQKVDATNLHTYKLGEHIIFYADKNLVLADGVEKKIQAQSCLLFELFLKESQNGYILKASVIMEKLWSDGSGNDARLHKAVARLRSFIKEIDPSLEIVKKVDTYQLIIP